MRPLSLKLSGFRSYRAEREISFRDLELVAIIGDTGAGKSSLLEAMTWALYGSSTWSQRSTSDLLAHGATRMSVALEFEAAGQVWRIVRTFARGGAGGAELVCLSDPAIAKVDGVRQVNPRVIEVLGLEYDVFCSCVLLPQGKFETLLKARPGERIDTLKSILRLDELARAHELAGDYARRLSARQLELVTARGRFRPEPAQDVANAEAVLATVEPERAALDAAFTRHTDLQSAAQAYRRTAEAARRSAERIRARHGDRATRLREIAARDDALSVALTGATDSADRALQEATRVEGEQAAADQHGLDIASLTRHEGVRAGLVSALSRRDRLRTRLQGLQRDLVEADAALASAVTAAGTARTALGEHDDATRSARTEADAAAAAATAALTALAGLEAALDAAEQAAGQRDEAQAKVEARRAEHVAASSLLEEAERVRGEAVGTREAVLRENAAAHAAAGCDPGDPCPVCERVLPTGFTAPVAHGVEAADTALAEAVTAVRVASGAEREASRELDLCSERHSAKTDASTTAEAAIATAAERVRDLAGTLVAVTGTVDAAAIVAIRGWAAAMGEASASAAGLLDAHEQKREALVEAVAATRDGQTRADGDAGTAARDVTAVERELTELTTEIAATARALPAFVAVDPDNVGADTLSAAQVAIAERLETAAELSRQREEANGRRTATAGEVTRIELELAREVSTPAATLRAELLALAAELDDPPEAPVAAARADALAAYATDLERLADAVLGTLDGEARAAEEAAERDVRAAADAMAATGLDGVEALTDRVGELRAEMLRARDERDEAARQVPGAERLDALIARAGSLGDAFQALHEILRDSRFVGFVVKRRQRALLAHASKVLDSITGRYAFTEDFQILDRESGLPRSPDTLSGGETFIASLALALGLVEVADRAGGDLRALFLDEGFGTLDAAILETAIDALEERAKAGRLIGVISHVPTVAERIDTVIEVTHSPEGSDLAVLTAAERDQRVLDAAAAVAAR